MSPPPPRWDLTLSAVTGLPLGCHVVGHRNVLSAVVVLLGTATRYCTGRRGEVGAGRSSVMDGV
eukprot:gene18814-biopygen11488